MNRPLLKWLLIVSLSLNLGVAATVVAGRIAGVGEGRHTQAAPVNLPDYLQLTDAQRRRWAEIERPFLEDIANNWRAIRAHREMLVRQVFSATPDRAVINVEQQRIAVLQDAQQRRVIEQLLAERALLNEKQRAQLMALLLNRYTQESTEEESLHRQ